MSFTIFIINIILAATAGFFIGALFELTRSKKALDGLYANFLAYEKSMQQYLEILRNANCQVMHKQEGIDEKV